MCIPSSWYRLAQDRRKWHNLCHEGMERIIRTGRDIASYNPVNSASLVSIAVVILDLATSNDINVEQEETKGRPEAIQP